VSGGCRKVDLQVARLKKIQVQNLGGGEPHSEYRGSAFTTVVTPWPYF